MLEEGRETGHELEELALGSAQLSLTPSQGQGLSVARRHLAVGRSE